jgi:hypothetical protein
MRIHTRCRPAQLAFICGGIVALAACTNAGMPEPGTRPFSPSAASVITEAEIADSHANTAYEAIERSHPLFLISRIDLAPLAEREVYLNGIHLGGLSELRGIPASSVREIRFVRAIDAGVSGFTHPGGAILVISKAGR